MLTTDHQLLGACLEYLDCAAAVSYDNEGIVAAYRSPVLL